MTAVNYLREIEKRRTFAIISHPDAGKTTLTEKLLLFGGAIQVAGAVKSNKIKRSTASDFMDIERQRGISVATSVMGFDYQGLRINLLDTPGHKDFAEDTYRTLTAVDSVILVIDSVKGVETQTEKLMEVCRMRQTPVIVFINKLDREGRNPFELLDELEEKLNITVRPLSWPVSMGASFKGVYNLYDTSLYLFKPGEDKLTNNGLEIDDLGDPLIDRHLGGHALQLRNDIDLIEGVYAPFERRQYLVTIAPTPGPRPADSRTVAPHEKDFSGFVFKIHANLDPRHRDRIAFLRVCSGKFDRDKFYRHVRLGKDLRFRSPASFMAREKTLIEDAFPGDVIGLYDTGNFKIGDTLTEGETILFQGIPNFSPEFFREVVNADPMKSKQLAKGIQQLTDEGVAQLFTQNQGNRKIIGTVGELQFDVIQYRLLHEYGASCSFRALNFFKACWITSENGRKMEAFCRNNTRHLAVDKDGNLVYFAESKWRLESEMEDNPEISFHFTSEFKRSAESHNRYSVTF